MLVYISPSAHWECPVSTKHAIACRQPSFRTWSQYPPFADCSPAPRGDMMRHGMAMFGCHEIEPLDYWIPPQKKIMIGFDLSSRNKVMFFSTENVSILVTHRNMFSNVLEVVRHFEFAQRFL